jgi:hypothetical protein
MKLLVIGYWVWFGISIIVLTRRVISKRGRRRAETRATPPGAPVAVPPTSIDDIAERVAARLAETAPVADPAPPVGPAATAPVPSAPVPVAPAPPAPTPIPAAVAPLVTPLAPTPGDASAPLAGSVFAPRLPQPVRSSLAGARTTLAELLRGIAMPSDLAPLVHVAGTDPDRRAVFCTTGHPVEIVGASVAAELQRLGFALEATGPTDAIARRGEHALAVRMRTIGAPPEKGPADPAYPTAPGGSVVLDLEIG